MCGEQRGCNASDHARCLLRSHAHAVWPRSLPPFSASFSCCTPFDFVRRPKALRRPFRSTNSIFFASFRAPVLRVSLESAFDHPAASASCPTLLISAETATPRTRVQGGTERNEDTDEGRGKGRGEREHRGRKGRVSGAGALERPQKGSIREPSRACTAGRTASREAKRAGWKTRRNALTAADGRTGHGGLGAGVGQKGVHGERTKTRSRGIETTGERVAFRRESEGGSKGNKGNRGMRGRTQAGKARGRDKGRRGPRESGGKERKRGGRLRNRGRPRERKESACALAKKKKKEKKTVSKARGKGEERNRDLSRVDHAW